MVNAHVINEVGDFGAAAGEDLPISLMDFRNTIQLLNFKTRLVKYRVEAPMISNIAKVVVFDMLSIPHLHYISKCNWPILGPNST